MSRFGCKISIVLKFIAGSRSLEVPREEEKCCCLGGRHMCASAVPLVKLTFLCFCIKTSFWSSYLKIVVQSESCRVFLKYNYMLTIIIEKKQSWFFFSWRSLFLSNWHCLCKQKSIAQSFQLPPENARSVTHAPDPGYFWWRQMQQLQCRILQPRVLDYVRRLCVCRLQLKLTLGTWSGTTDAGAACNQPAATTH